MNKAWPRSILARSAGTRAGILIAFGAPAAKSGDRLFTWPTTARISSALRRSRKYGIALACRPFVTTRIRSSSDGSSPGAVDLNLKRPRVKSRGRGMSDGAAGAVPAAVRSVADRAIPREDALPGGSGWWHIGSRRPGQIGIERWLGLPEMVLAGVNAASVNRSSDVQADQSEERDEHDRRARETLHDRIGDSMSRRSGVALASWRSEM